MFTLRDLSIGRWRMNVRIMLLQAVAGIGSPPLLHSANWSVKDVMLQSWAGQGTAKCDFANYFA